LLGQKKVTKKSRPVAAWVLRCYENHPWFSPFGPAYRWSNSLPANLSLSAGGDRRVIMTLDRRAESILRPLRVIPAESSDARRGKRDKNTKPETQNLS
jgi:hypothetical protein